MKSLYLRFLYIEYGIAFRELCSVSYVSSMRSNQGPTKQTALRDELAVLSRQQADALEHATYFRMTPEEALEFDQRAERMNEIFSLLNQAKAS